MYNTLIRMRMKFGNEMRLVKMIDMLKRSDSIEAMRCIEEISNWPFCYEYGTVISYEDAKSIYEDRLDLFRTGIPGHEIPSGLEHVVHSLKEIDEAELVRISSLISKECHYAIFTKAQSETLIGIVRHLSENLEKFQGQKEKGAEGIDFSCFDNIEEVLNES